MTPGLRQDWTLVDWIEGLYNHVHMHTTIGYMALVTKERSLLDASLGVCGNEAGSCYLRESFQSKGLAFAHRNEAVKACRRLGRAIWKR